MPNTLAMLGAVGWTVECQTRWQCSVPWDGQLNAKHAGNARCRGMDSWMPNTLAMLCVVGWTLGCQTRWQCSVLWNGRLDDLLESMQSTMHSACYSTGLRNGVIGRK